MKKWITANKQSKLGVKSERNFGLRDTRRRGVSEGKLQFVDSPLMRYLNLDPEKSYHIDAFKTWLNETDNVYLQERLDSDYDFTAFLDDKNADQLKNRSGSSFFLILENQEETEVEFSFLLSSSSGEVCVEWEDGSKEYGKSFSRVYSQPNSGFIKIYNPENDVDITEFRLKKGKCKADITQLRKSKLKNFYLYSYDNFYGDLNGLPKTLERIDIAYSSNTISGSVNDLGNDLDYLFLSGKGVIKGDFNSASIMPNLTYFAVRNKTEITGDIAFLPRNLWYFLISTGNTLYGDIANLPDGIQHLTINGQNTVSGNLIDWKDSLIGVTIAGLNTIEGDITHFGSSLKNVTIAGYNQVDGNLSSLKDGLVSFSVQGHNTVTGDIATLPTSLNSITLDGNNTAFGTLQSLHEGIGVFIAYGNNTITGDLSGLPSTLTFFKYENNLPTGLTYSNSIQFTKINQWHLIGNAGGLTNADIDQLLIDFDTNITEFVIGKTVVFGLAGLARTSTSDVAYNSLVSKGVNVSVSKV